MDLIKNCRIHCLSEALSPITHMMGTNGNEAVINREPVLYKNEIRQIPVLSGNAIRHRMVRDTGGTYVIKECGLYGKLNIDQANYLLNGGSLTESSTNENMKRIADMQELMPLTRLLGGSLRNQVVGGSLYVLRGLLVCEENRNQIQKLLPQGYELPEQQLRPAEDFISQYQYTRGESAKRNDAGQLLAEVPDADAKSNLMIYNGQDVIPGSVFYHGFILQSVSPLEVGALIHALQLWDNAGGFIGGQSRIGHGKMKMSIFFENGEDFFGNELDPVKLVSDYVAHIHTHSADIANWLNDAFPSKSKKQEALKI